MLSLPLFNQKTQLLLTAGLSDYCGPTTPGSPFESPGLGYSEFARHYYRNHNCFLFLQVLRWFTSLRSLRTPMDSVHGKLSSLSLGFPIRTSPDQRLLASPRGLSQLATSFIAFWCQGIHTYALSSLTIKLTLDTVVTTFGAPDAPSHNLLVSQASCPAFRSWRPTFRYALQVAWGVRAFAL